MAGLQERTAAYLPDVSRIRTYGIISHFSKHTEFVDRRVPVASINAFIHTRAHAHLQIQGATQLSRVCTRNRKENRGSMLTSDDIARFSEDGVLLVRDVVSPAWLRFLRDATDDLEDTPGPLSEVLTNKTPCERSNVSASDRLQAPSIIFSGSVAKNYQRAEYFTDMEMAQRLHAFDEFAKRGPCAEIAGTLMRSDRVHFLYDQYFRQRADFGKTRAPYTPWHQDQPYWQVSGEQVVSIWVPLDQTPPGYEVQFIKGSHQWQEHSPFHFGTGDQYKGTGQPQLPDINAGISQHRYEVLSFPGAMPGDVVVFSAMTVHGQAPGNVAATLAVGETSDRGHQHQGQKKKKSSCSSSSSNTTSSSSRHYKRRSKVKNKGTLASAGSSGSATRFRRIAMRFTGDDARYFPRKGEAADVVPSVHFPCDLEAGDEMECARFPLVWTRWDGLVSDSSRL